MVAGLTYLLTKKRDRDAELRREKLEHYKRFARSLSGVCNGSPPSRDEQAAFAQACNDLNLIAPQSVLQALNDLPEQIDSGNKQRPSGYSNRLFKQFSLLFLEIRRDLGMKPRDSADTFSIGLFALTAGQPDSSECQA